MFRTKYETLLHFIKSGGVFYSHLIFVFVLKFARNLNHLEFLGLNASLLLLYVMGAKLGKIVYSIWLGPLLGQSTNLTKMGSWAVVTGATDGIGLSYAKELARQGINIVLMSRTLSRLENISKMLESEFKIETKIIVIDFSKNIDIYDNVEKTLSNLEIGTLINNVGMCYECPSYFHEIEDSKKFINDILNTNILSVTMMTKLVLPQMVQRGKGVVINVGSGTSAAPVPLLTLYAASKSFMESFTAGLLEEYRDKGIIFQYLYPGYVSTKLSKIKDTSIWTPSPEQFVSMAVKTIGIRDKTLVWIPHEIGLAAYQWGTFLFPWVARDLRIEGTKTLWLYAVKKKMIKSMKKE